MAKTTKKKPGVAASKGKGVGKPGKVKLSAAPSSYTGGTGIKQELPTKKAGRGKYSR